MLEKLEFIKFLEFKDYLFLILSLILIIALVIFLFLFFKPKKKNIKTKNQKDNIEELLEVMQKDLEQKQEVRVPSFEEEQEAKAIISYKELLEAKSNNQEQVSQEVIEENTNEDELSTILKTNIDLISNQNNTSESKFMNSEVISPIFGRMTYDEQRPKQPVTNEEPVYMSREEKNISPKSEVLSLDSIIEKEEIEVLSLEPSLNQNYDLEETLNIRPIPKEVKKDEDFLNSLKDLRKNL
ncbi:MAG: hypothetical protein PHU94_00945 [Bacilli bacterium]|nr:hypothetical protein [Bacilli bacterium]MDD4733486.1 hypothetical protein [Bacilli bacterium]